MVDSPAETPDDEPIFPGDKDYGDIITKIVALSKLPGIGKQVCITNHGYAIGFGDVLLLHIHKFIDQWGYCIDAHGNILAGRCGHTWTPVHALREGVRALAIFAQSEELTSLSRGGEVVGTDALRAFFACMHSHVFSELTDLGIIIARTRNVLGDVDPLMN